MTTTLELDAIERRANPWITALAAAPFAALVPLLVAAALVHPGLAVFSIHLVAFGALATIVTRREKPFARRVSVKVRVDERGATIVRRGGAEETIPTAAIQRGLKFPDQTGTAVRLSRKGRSKSNRELMFADEAAADRLLTSLGQDTAHTKASFRAMSRSHASTGRSLATVFGGMFGAMTLGVIAAAVAPLMAPWILVTAVVALLVITLWPTRVDVGADGVLVRWLGTERFIRHADIAKIVVTVQGPERNRRNVVVLTLSSGELVNIPTGAAKWDGQIAEMLATRIDDAGDAADRNDVAPQALLARGDRSFSAWVAALRARDLVSLRTPAVSDEQLWRVVEDPSADAIDRAAAVVALGPATRDAQRTRLANAAKVVAAPKLRVVLEKALDADDAELAEMLEEVESRTRAGK